eukprot:TRINITY_DN5598_c0_g1_i1.p1 TRINITY_DN5598_c0_g1~~TRINITY_DN5598_c0_g1_i1.p1  ORF type:complete len:130 (+),score=12.98 TRINITY_DN5598_c0_g1_i1:41-391(+)
MRFKMMLYDDPDSNLITSEKIWDILEEDISIINTILWVGISFEQSASLEYFRKVALGLQKQNRQNLVRQLIINTDDDSIHNMQSATSSSSSQNLVLVKMKADDALTRIVHLLNLVK